MRREIFSVLLFATVAPFAHAAYMNNPAVCRGALIAPDDFRDSVQSLGALIKEDHPPREDVVYLSARIASLKTKNSYLSNEKSQGFATKPREKASDKKLKQLAQEWLEKIQTAFQNDAEGNTEALGDLLYREMTPNSLMAVKSVDLDLYLYLETLRLWTKFADSLYTGGASFKRALKSIATRSLDDFARGKTALPTTWQFTHALSERVDPDLAGFVNIAMMPVHYQAQHMTMQDSKPLEIASLIDESLKGFWIAKKMNHLRRPKHLFLRAGDEVLIAETANPQNPALRICLVGKSGELSHLTHSFDVIPLAPESLSGVSKR